MGKTYRRNQSLKPKGKDFKFFKKSNKFKNWDDKPTHNKPLIEITNEDPTT